MRKKLLSVLLVASLATTMFTGCAKDEKGAGGEEGGKVTVNLGIWPSEELVDDVKTFEGYKKTMAELHPNVIIEPDHYTYATDTFVSLAASGNCPTIFGW